MKTLPPFLRKLLNEHPNAVREALNELRHSDSKPAKIKIGKDTFVFIEPVRRREE